MISGRYSVGVGAVLMTVWMVLIALVTVFWTFVSSDFAGEVDPDPLPDPDPPPDPDPLPDPAPGDPDPVLPAPDDPEPEGEPARAPGAACAGLPADPVEIGALAPAAAPEEPTAAPPRSRSETLCALRSPWCRAPRRPPPAAALTGCGIRVLMAAWTW